MKCIGKRKFELDEGEMLITNPTLKIRDNILISHIDKLNLEKIKAIITTA